MFTFKNFILLATAAAISECYHTDIGVKGGLGQSIKSYGGYFPDTTGFNQAANDLAYSPTYHRPIVSSYQPYGWNFNQPTRTYGGVNVLQTPRYNFGSTGGYGWTNSGWNTRIHSRPVVPQVPSLFQPNFVPPVYFPGTVSYPSFGSYPGLFPQYNPGFAAQTPVYPATGLDGTAFPGNTPALPGGGVGVPASTLPGAANPGVANPGAVSPPVGGGGASSGGGGAGGSSGGGGSSSGGGSGSSSTSGGGSGGGSTTSSSGTSFTTSSFDSVNSESNQNGVYAFSHNPFYPPPTQHEAPVFNNQYIPPYPPQRPSHPHPDDQTAFETNNQREAHRPIAPVPGTQKPTINLPYPTQSHPDQTAFESNNQHAVQRPIAPIPDKQKPEMDLSRFPSSSLFNEDRHDWTVDDEMKWQATTKAPYFENKAPGLGCTLPAAAVLGAMSAMKVSSLLPLNVPIRKPILACNATELLQAQINLNGKIYDCKGSSITVACSTHGECPSETLECDVNMRQMDAYSVTCTNGTLISNSNIVCESATLAVGKNVLNCYFKDAVRTPETATSVIPLQTPAPVHEDYDENLLDDRKNVEVVEGSELVPQVKNAMQNVFPHELLAMPSTMYLPQKQTMPPRISAELQKHVDDVFNVELLASSQTKEADNTVIVESNTDSSRLSQTDVERLSENWRDHAQSRWNVNSNIKSASSGTKTAQRFGGSSPTQQDMHDRLIFTD